MMLRRLVYISVAIMPVLGIACSPKTPSAPAPSVHPDSIIVWGQAETLPIEVQERGQISWRPSCVDACAPGKSGRSATLLFTKMEMSLVNGNDPLVGGKVASVRVPFRAQVHSDSLQLTHGIRLSVSKSSDSHVTVLVHAAGRTDVIDFPRGLVIDAPLDTLVEFSRVIPTSSQMDLVTLIVFADRDSTGLAFVSLDSDDLRAAPR